MPDWIRTYDADEHKPQTVCFMGVDVGSPDGDMTVRAIYERDGDGLKLVRLDERDVPPKPDENPS